VMTHRGVGVVAYPFVSAFERVVRGLATIDEGRNDRSTDLVAELCARLLEMIEVLLVLGPRLLRDHQHPHALLRHDVAGLGRDDRAVKTLGEIAMARLRADAHLGNLEVLALV